jgi:hypothetical protein
MAIDTEIVPANEKQPGLVRYEAMCRAIAECHKVDEVKDLRDKAKALEVYAQQAQNLEAERKACEIRIRAERRAGELLREMKERGKLQRRGGAGGHNKKQTSSETRFAPASDWTEKIDEYRDRQVLRDADAVEMASDTEPRGRPPTLSNLGITYDQSSKWQQLADVPAEEFERAVTGDGPKPSTEGIINANLLREHPQQKIDPDALWLWGRLRDFERNEILKREPNDLLIAMTDSMRDDCFRITPRVLAWLEEVEEIADGTNGRAT